MEAYKIGERIKEFRLRQKISQEELSFDICAVSTLSRIENGLQIPNRKIIEALFSKMGLIPPKITSDVIQIQTERWRIEKSIDVKIYSGDYEILELLEDYANIGEMDCFEKQFYLFHKSLYLKHHNEKLEYILNLETESLFCTVTNFDLENPDKERLFTKIELMIIDDIAFVYNDLGLTEKAVSLIEFVKNYLETKSVTNDFKISYYSECLCFLADNAKTSGNYERCVELCNSGINFTSKHMILYDFVQFVFIKGISLLHLKKIDEGNELVQDALMMLEYCKDYEMIEELKKELKDL